MVARVADACADMVTLLDEDLANVASNISRGTVHCAYYDRIAAEYCASDNSQLRSRQSRTVPLRTGNRAVCGADSHRGGTACGQSKARSGSATRPSSLSLAGRRRGYGEHAREHGKFSSTFSDVRPGDGRGVLIRKF